MAATITERYTTVDEVYTGLKQAEATGVISVENYGGEVVFIADKAGNKGHLTKTESGYTAHFEGKSFDVEVNDKGQITKIDGQNASNGVIIDEENKVIVDKDPQIDANRQAIENLYKDIDAGGQKVEEAAGRAYADAVTDYNSLDSRITDNTKKIAGLETEMKKMGDKMLDLEDRMDGVVATSHAVTNARPMVQDAGEFAMGVGIGAAGSKQALALGGAYQFSQNWSASTTVNYETAGKRSKSQFSAGAGVHYRFK
ncbi:hypothetical protein JCM19240_5767 [Vibrio maritimus]|uniref:Trimeric autotransporter adhesin YadA-like C-terminal membrane anchor domain-containing protein n=1 Tax=Vibrio maritimus TaxID=990268 RepID=A0A090SXA5_9VIBR|nr:hypothetical protein JCM19240_5767 [Vibrio maritimus]